MKSTFFHRHAADYMEAWTKLSNLMMYNFSTKQMDILLHARAEIEKGAKKRALTQGRRELEYSEVSYTDTELAQLAAIDEHIFARSGKDNGSPAVRDKYIIEIGEYDS